MAKQIIILDQPEAKRYRVAFWATVPAARVAFYADATKVSAWKDISAGEQTALRNGQVVEQVRELVVQQGETIGQVQTRLQNEFTAFQNEVTARNDWGRYGTFWDGSTWTNGGVS